MVRQQHLKFFVPSNRLGSRGVTHLDGMNEIINANRTNRYVGAKQERENVANVQAFAEVAMRQQHWLPLNRRKAHVKVTFVEVDARRDVSNIYGGLKFVLDGLSHPRGSKTLGAGAIWDDSPKWVECEAHVRIDKDNPGAEIEIWEVATND